MNIRKMPIMRIPMIYYTIEQGVLIIQLILSLYTLYLFRVTRQLTTRRAILTMTVCAMALGDYGYIRFSNVPQTIEFIANDLAWFGVRNLLTAFYWERWGLHAWNMVKAV